MDQKLAMKIFNIMEKTKALEKNVTVGKETSVNSYKAIGEATVLNEMKPLFKEFKVIMFPSKTIAKEITEQYPDPYDKTKTKLKSITQLVITFTIVDAETGESIDIEVAGNGFDSLDKGTGKATTYAYKTALQKTFMLFSGEDTDNHHSDDTTHTNKDDDTTTIITETHNLSEKQVKRLIAIAISKGYTAENVKNGAKKKYNVDELDNMTKTQYNEIVKGYENCEHK